MTPQDPIVALCYCGDSTCKIPYGTCHCGCNENTTIIQETNSPQGRIKGFPALYRSGHNQSRLVHPVVEDAVPFKIEREYCRLIPLSRGLYAIIWACDYEWLMQWKWYAMWSSASETYYAVRDERRKRGGSGKCILMHRAIAERHNLRLVDHADHNGLNCTQSNLRPCTDTQSLGNTRLRKDNKLRIKGVQETRSGRFIARIRHCGIVERFGPFDFPEEAGEAYKTAAIRVFGKFACVEKKPTYGGQPASKPKEGLFDE